MDFLKLSLMEITKLVREFHARHAKKDLVCSTIGKEGRGEIIFLPLYT